MKQSIKCELCKNYAELFHHIDYTTQKTIPVCQICHKKIHAAIKNPQHFSKSKYLYYAPNGNPTSKTISILPEHYLKIKNLNKEVSFSRNMREIVNKYLDFHTIFEMRFYKYYLSLKKKNDV